MSVIEQDEPNLSSKEKDLPILVGGNGVDVESDTINLDRFVKTVASVAKTPGLQGIPPEGIVLNELELLTDTGNGKRFKRMYDDKLFYSSRESCWRFFDGKRWLKLSENDMVSLARGVAYSIVEIEIPWLKYLKRQPASESAKKASIKNGDVEQLTSDWISKQLNNGSIASTIKAAMSIMSRDIMVDANPNLLNVQNGTIDLEAGCLKPHNPADYITRLAPVVYDPNASYPRLSKILKRMFPDNTDAIKFLQKVFGYATTGRIDEKALFILYGPGGNNGKSLLCNILYRLLSDEYCTTVNINSLITKQSSSIRPDLMRLESARVALVSESNKATKFDEACLKTLTGGGDRMTGRMLFQNTKSFIPVCKLIIPANFEHEFTIGDEAMKDRVYQIRFDVTIPKNERNADLLDIMIAEESSGILNFLIEGAGLWYKEGLLNNPFGQQVKFRVEASVEHFLSEYCDTQIRGTSLPVDIIRKAYHAYQDLMHDMNPDISHVQLSAELDKLGYKRSEITSTDGKKQVIRHQIRLNERGRALVPDIAPLYTDLSATVGTSPVIDACTITPETELNTNTEKKGRKKKESCNPTEK